MATVNGKKSEKKGLTKPPFSAIIQSERRKENTTNVRNLLQQSDGYEEDRDHQRGNHLGLLR